MINKLEGSLLSLSIIEHCFERKELKSSAFSSKSVINLLSWNKGGIHGIFLWFRHLFKIDHYVFGYVVGPIGFLDIRVQYYLLVVSIELLGLFCRHCSFFTEFLFDGIVELEGHCVRTDKLTL